MSKSKIVIVKDTIPTPDHKANYEVITINELKSWVNSGEFFKSVFKYSEAKLYCSSLDVMYKPFTSAVLLRMLSRGTCGFEDESGCTIKVTTRLILKYLRQVLTDFVYKRRLINLIENDIKKCRTLQLSAEGKRKVSNPNMPTGIIAASPIYLRTDFVFGLRSGGSIGHIAGVLNNLENFSGKPVFFSSDHIPTVRDDIETHIVRPGVNFREFAALLSLNYNNMFVKCLRDFLNRSKRMPSLIYQRYSLNNYAGAKLSLEFGIPFVLEYNGSEIWMNRNWGRPLKYEDLSERIELLNISAADVVVVVSKAMKDELVERSTYPDKILVNPNGVNPDKYSPEIDGFPIRSRLGLEGKIIIGFIGTFGLWHGAEVLAEAFGCLMRDHPEYRSNVRLLMIGDGVTMPQVKENLKKLQVLDETVLAGLVSQEKGPSYLAACDILVSPHVPNPDGTPFFGSPTKLFEYMAMGKGIVASDLDQIGEILEHDKTAWMVKPADIDGLVDGLEVLIENENLRDRLGKAARVEVVDKYTWKEHTRKIVEKLKERIS